MYTYRIEHLGKALYFLIPCIAFAVGQRDVDISVNGNLVAKTNIATYTIFDTDDAEFERTLTISCLSFVPVPSTISLIRGDTILNQTRIDSPHNKTTVMTKLTYNKVNVTYIEGAYSCRLSLLQTYNVSQFEYFLKSELQIKATTQPRVCASSIGFSGYLGERVTLTCEDNSYSLYANFFQGEWFRSQYLLQVNLLETSTFECTRSLDSRRVCSAEFTVHQFLEIEISPTNFNLDSQVMEFFCNSTPPRLLYWELIGDDENIIELYNIDQLLQDGRNIQINQKAEWSSLRVSTSIMDSNGRKNPVIRKVVCSAYGARSRTAAYASLRPDSNTYHSCYECLRTFLLDSATSGATQDKEKAYNMNWLIVLVIGLVVII